MPQHVCDKTGKLLLICKFVPVWIVAWKMEILTNFLGCLCERKGTWVEHDAVSQENHDYQTHAIDGEEISRDCLKRFGDRQREEQHDNHELVEHQDRTDKNKTKYHSLSIEGNAKNSTPRFYFDWLWFSPTFGKHLISLFISFFLSNLGQPIAKIKLRGSYIHCYLLFFPNFLPVMTAKHHSTVNLSENKVEQKESDTVSICDETSMNRIRDKG